MSTTGETIGVKLAFDGQMRRFPLARGTSFNSLHDQVIALLGLEKDSDIVLKYTDEEGDDVTIASDLELNSAIAPGQLLRLVVTRRNPLPPPQPQVFTHPQPNLVHESVQVPPLPADAGGMFRAFGHGGFGGRGPAPWERAPPHFGPHDGHPPHFGPHGGHPLVPPFVGERGEPLEDASHPPHFGGNYGHPHFGRGGHHHGRGGFGGGRGGFGGFGRGFGPLVHTEKNIKKWRKEIEKSNKRAYKLEKADKETRLVARFAKDVTVADGSKLAPNTPFVKTWRVRNEGPEWPAGCVLRFLGKHSDKFGGPELVPLPFEGPVATNAEIDISVNLIAPEKPGRYTAYWKMCTPDGRKFGQRVWASIVVLSDSSSSSSSSSSSDEEADKIDDLVDSMLAMGFDAKRHKIFRLLKKNKGDVEKVSRKLEKYQKKKAKKSRD